MSEIFRSSISIPKLHAWFEILKTKDIKEKGILFEHLCANILRYDPRYNFKKIYLYEECPASIKTRLNLPCTDRGIDIIAIKDVYGSVSNRLEYIGVQCKYRSDRYENVREEVTGTFSQQLLRADISGIYMTNCYEINECMRRTSRIKCMYGTFFNDELQPVYDIIRKKILDIDDKDIIKEYVLRDYQIECIDRCKEFLNDDSDSENESISEDESESIKCNKSSGILNLACGSGKTLVLYHVAMSAVKLNNSCKDGTTTIIVGVPSLQLLSQIFMNWMIYHYYDSSIDIDTMIIGSSIDVHDLNNIDQNYSGIDCTTDIDTIIGRLKMWTSTSTNICKRANIIFTTYQSSEILVSAIRSLSMHIDLVIFDEAHHMTGKISSDNCMVEPMIKDEKTRRIYATATLRYLQGTYTYDDPVRFPDEINVFVNKKGHMIYSMNDISIFGKVLYTFNIRDAIDKGALCGYDILSFVETNKRLEYYIEKRNLLLTRDEYGNELEFTSHQYMCAILLISTMLRVDDTVQSDTISIEKVFTYHSSVSDSKRFVKLLKHVKNVLYPEKEYPEKEYPEKEYPEKEYPEKEYPEKDIYIDSIDGNISIKNRTRILAEFKTSSMSILCSCKVLGEGIDMKECDTVMFIDGKNSTVDIVQSFGRCLRNYNRSVSDRDNREIKKRATIIIPTILEKDNDSMFDNIKKILGTISKHDGEIVAYFKERKEGRSGNGKISYNCKGIEDVDLDSIETIDIIDVASIVSAKIYDTVDSWEIRLQELEEFITEHRKKPNKRSKDEYEKSLGCWISNNNTQYKNNINCMKDIDKRRLWKNMIDRYMYILGSKDDIWSLKFEIINKYIEENKKRPSKDMKFDDDTSMSAWVQTQVNNYNNNKNSMNKDKYLEQRDLFIKLIIQYPILFKEKKIKSEIIMTFFEKFKIIKEYIEENKKRPSRDMKFDDDTSMGGWIKNQLKNYNNNKNSMNKEKQPEQRRLFTELLRSYPDLFKDVILDD